MSAAVEPDTLPVPLVEESPTDRVLIERALAQRVTTVADAVRALDAARHQSFAAIAIAQAPARPQRVRGHRHRPPDLQANRRGAR
jgi:CheY-like chemotaxis protein